MKKLALVVAMIVGVTGALAQATVTMANTSSFLGGTAQPISDMEGTALAGNAYLVTLYAAPEASGGAEDSLVPLGQTFPFRVNGLFSAGDVTIANVAPAANAWVQVRAWEAAGGADYDTAWEGGFQAGKSNIFLIETGGAVVPPKTAGTLQGLQSFSLSIIPEPSVFALGLVGGLGLMLRRRR